MPVPLAPRTTESSKTSDKHSGSTNPAIIGVAIAVAFIFVGIAAYVYVAKRRAPDYHTTPQQSKWKLRIRQSKLGRLLRLKTPTKSVNGHDMEETSYTPSTNATETASRSGNATITTAEGPNRNTSVRSIMTLPPYQATPRPHERLIAREGERAGVDTVIEFPETADEEEMRREEEMDSLYQIRQARRQAIAERNERRRERAEARAAGDWARLEQLRLQNQMRTRSRAESTGSNASSVIEGVATPVSSLLADHHARTASNDRRVSSVSYADLGLARHDGSRIRADSVESDHVPLLPSAASMGSERTPPSSRRGSRFQTPIFHHNRGVSAESVITTDSDLINEMTPQTSSGDRSGSDPAPRTPSASPENSNSEPSPPMGQPPEYEDAPPYTSPVNGPGEGVPRLPSVRIGASLPAIQVTGSTPAATPLVGRGEISPRE